MSYQLLEGVVSHLERTTHISGGGETAARTTHLSMFGLAGRRVLLQTLVPAMIANGDALKMVGIEGQGQFTAFACKNLATGWATTYRKRSTLKFSLIALIVIFLPISWFSLLFLIVPICLGIMLIQITKEEAAMKKVHDMIHSIS